MTRYAAFLRAINVGGHTVKMEALRDLFTALGLADVETFIASGNVIFTTDAQADRALAARIEAHLQQALGYAVATFVRSAAEVAAVARHPAFAPTALAAATAYNVAFLGEPLDEPAQQKLMALRTEIDDFHVHGREIYWLCRKKQSESTFSNAVLEKTIRRPATLRGMATVQKMAEKFDFR